MTIVYTRGHAAPVLQVRPRAGGPRAHVSPFVPREPHHFVVPYLAKRKTTVYQEDVSERFALQVAPEFSYLAAKLSRLSNPSFPGHDEYVRTCREILGFVVTAVPSANGQRPGVYLPDRETLSIDQMGEGVPNIVGMLADLALSAGKLFLIEEPENDLHPSALKALLELICESAQRNQFVVSTHSNIVARHLGGVDGSRLFYVDADRGQMPPEARIREVESTPAARVAVLRDLGYSFSDFDLWDGWLILEESSAERIVRDYLIPWFAPKLSRVRTLAAGGTSRVEPTFEDLARMVLFTHLEEAYRGRAWVRLDGDAAGQQAVERLRERYSNWKPENFGCFTEPQFERYYPSEFSSRAEDVLVIPDKQARRAAKRELLEAVRVWLDEDEDRGRAALGESAAEVIADLQDIECQLLDESAPSALSPGS